MTTEEAVMIGEALAQAETKEIYVVGLHDPKVRFYIERPDDHGESRGPDESILRVFLDEAEAERYLESVKVYIDKEIAFDVLEMSLEELWKPLMRDLDGIEHVFESVLRVDLCSMPEGSYPQRIDTLYSELDTMH